MVNGGDIVTMDTTATESVEIPEDVRYALKQKPGALEAFQALPAEKQREMLESILTANMSDIRDGRINRLVDKLGK
jgi:uncharacterized protein YdeI (YjbR/CyaY-like superfamily)